MDLSFSHLAQQHPATSWPSPSPGKQDTSSPALRPRQHTSTHLQVPGGPWRADWLGSGAIKGGEGWGDTLVGLCHRFCYVPESPDPLNRLSFKGLHGNGPAYDTPGGQMGRAKDWHRVTMNVVPDKLPGPSTGDHTQGAWFRPMGILQGLL